MIPEELLQAIRPGIIDACVRRNLIFGGVGIVPEGVKVVVSKVGDATRFERVFATPTTNPDLSVPLREWLDSLKGAA